MFGRTRQQQTTIENLQAQNARLEGLVGLLAERAGVGEAELERLREESGAPRVPEECRRLVAEGKVIEAIKVYRERTGASLKDAKDAIDRFRGIALSGLRPSSAPGPTIPAAGSSHRRMCPSPGSGRVRT